MKFPSLEELEITFANGIMELWNLSDVDEEVPAFSRLVNLTLDNLPELRSIWRSNNIVIHRSFRSLKSLKVSHCPKLEILCLFSVVEAFEQLETLNVHENDNMKEIIAKETGEIKNNDTGMTVFPKLQNIELKSLSNLKCFFGGSIKLKFPSLKSIDCNDLNKMVAFVSPKDSGALFNDKLQHVKELILEGCEAQLEPFDLKRRASAILPQLARLTLSKMHRLQMILWKISPIENLHYLHINNIDGLKFLFPASLGSKGFAQLEEIHIEDCKDIEHVLAPESIEDTSNNAASTTIVLPRVKIIKLSWLQSLRSFSSDNYKDLEFPSLEEVQIRQCPMVEIFSYGSLSTPRLCKIKINWNEKIEHLDLNAVIKNRKEEEMRLLHRRMKEEKMSKDAKTKFIKGETSQGIEEDEISKDAETKFIEGETSQRIEEETSREDTKIQSIEGETSRGKQKKKMSKDAETKFIEGETSQRIEEETSREDTKTQSIEGETSQWVEEETSGKDTETEVTWWRRKFEVYDQYFENWTELFGLILYPLLRALVIILMIWIFIRAFEIDADPNTKSKANSNPLFKGNEL